MIAIVTVYHALPDGKISPVVARFKFPIIAEPPPAIEVDDMLEVAFERTNSIDEPWWKGENARGAARNGCRSTSVGDLMLVRFPNSSQKYRVAPVGFERCS